MDGFNTKPHNPPAVQGTEASMLRHIYEMTGKMLVSHERIPDPGPMRSPVWKPVTYKLWQKTPRSRVAQSHKSYGD